MARKQQSRRRIQGGENEKEAATANAGAPPANATKSTNGINQLATEVKANTNALKAKVEKLEEMVNKSGAPAEGEAPAGEPAANGAEEVAAQEGGRRKKASKSKKAKKSSKSKKSKASKASKASKKSKKARKSQKSKKSKKGNRV